MVGLGRANRGLSLLPRASGRIRQTSTAGRSSCALLSRDARRTSAWSFRVAPPLTRIHCRPRRRSIGVDGVAGVVAALNELGPKCALVDIEPLVAAWASGPDALSSGIIETVEALAKVKSVRRIAFLTNSRRRLDVMPASVASVELSYTARAMKPWKVRELRGLPKPLVVVGDQVLTDGLLAFRLDADFVLVCSISAPWWPRLQAWAGKYLLPYIFVTAIRRGM